MTKADRIRTLYAAGKTAREIAEIVGCHQSYVRTAARQRINGKSSEADKSYAKQKWQAAKKYGDYAAARTAAEQAKRDGKSAKAAYIATLYKTASVNIPKAS